MANTIIGKDTFKKKYPIQPQNISGKYFPEAFCNVATEMAAVCLILFCQEKNSWAPFKKKEINSFCMHEFYFYGLCPENDEANEDNLIILGENGLYHFTHEFVARCFAASPSLKLKIKAKNKKESLTKRGRHESALSSSLQ